MPPVLTKLTKSIMTLAINIILLVLTVVAVIMVVWSCNREMRYLRTFKGRLIQVELDNEHIKTELRSLSRLLSQLEEALDSMGEHGNAPKMLIVGTTFGVSKECIEKTVKKDANTIEKEKEKPTPKRTTASFAATHREQYLNLRKQGLSVREAGAKLGISYTTACRYEHWAKSNAKELLRK